MMCNSTQKKEGLRKAAPLFCVRLADASTYSLPLGLFNEGLKRIY